MVLICGFCRLMVEVLGIKEESIGRVSVVDWVNWKPLIKSMPQGTYTAYKRVDVLTCMIGIGLN